MIEYMHKRNGAHWIMWPQQGLKVAPAHFLNHIIKINGELYLNWTTKFVEAYEKERMWERLSD